MQVIKPTESLIKKLEEIAINAFPSIKSEIYDGWLLRFSNGYTYRANCINPLFETNIDLGIKISYCENKYFSQNLPTVYKMTEFSLPGLDGHLNELGYQIRKQADIMIIKLSETDVKECIDKVIISEKIEDFWMDRFLELNGIKEQLKKNTAKMMLSNIPNRIFCAYIKKNNHIVGCGLGVLERNYIGLFDIYVDENYRKQGIGRNICIAIINAGLMAGATDAYLQVASLNNAAIKLYEKLGFSKLYTYWYRVKENDSLEKNMHIAISD